MKVLLDQGAPAPLRRHLSGHSVATAFERGWSELQNGDLLDAAEREGYGFSSRPIKACDTNRISPADNWQSSCFFLLRGPAFAAGSERSAPPSIVSALATTSKSQSKTMDDVSPLDAGKKGSSLQSPGLLSGISAVQAEISYSRLGSGRVDRFEDNIAESVDQLRRHCWSGHQDDDIS